MKRTLSRLAGFLLVASFAGFAMAGCAHVKPWEKGGLARLEQHVTRCSGARGYESHMWMVREGPVGGTGEPGGGCGCN